MHISLQMTYGQTDETSHQHYLITLTA